jgi:hypothetical protein
MTNMGCQGACDIVAMSAHLSPRRQPDVPDVQRQLLDVLPARGAVYAGV